MTIFLTPWDAQKKIAAFAETKRAATPVIARWGIPSGGAVAVVISTVEFTGVFLAQSIGFRAKCTQTAYILLKIQEITRKQAIFGYPEQIAATPIGSALMSNGLVTAIMQFSN